MGVFDELREQLRLLYIAGELPPEQAERELGNNIAVKHALAMIDAYECEHPGLVDLTRPAELHVIEADVCCSAARSAGRCAVLRVGTVMSGRVVIHCHIDDTENGPELVFEDELEFVMTKDYGQIPAGNLHDICRQAVVSELFMATKDYK